MSHSRSVTEPLFIDTNMQYNLDRSLFPGIDDTFSNSQPALLIAQSKTWTTPTSNSYYNVENENLSEKANSDHLYNFNESFDLLATLVGTGELEELLNELLQSSNIDGSLNLPQQRYSEIGSKLLQTNLFSDSSAAVSQQDSGYCMSASHSEVSFQRSFNEVRPLSSAFDSQYHNARDAGVKQKFVRDHEQERTLRKQTC